MKDPALSSLFIRIQSTDKPVETSLEDACRLPLGVVTVNRGDRDHPVDTILATPIPANFLLHQILSVAQAIKLEGRRGGSPDRRVFPTYGFKTSLLRL